MLFLPPPPQLQSLLLDPRRHLLHVVMIPATTVHVCCSALPELGEGSLLHCGSVGCTKGHDFFSFSFCKCSLDYLVYVMYMNTNLAMATSRDANEED
ncbi:hypothetical protein BCR44DRAFT_168706 [Catenaria anguillulae PL171]|uniref:Uncharacterized protein n=1 Tax=Catenaria anguillulae PL171 TaxID=765915 RepID=A0A1Y2HG22_9FUNG|nr:hypothetical protein BCR44DRAFT_168706 [Catenaria anguillulae PL171]